MPESHAWDVAFRAVPLPYEILFEEVPCYISVQDRTYRILKTNYRFRESFQNKKGSYCYEIYKNRHEKCPVCVVEKTFRDGQSHRSEETWICQDGKVVEVIVYTTPICDEQGEIVAVMEMSTDIPVVKSLQRRLKESEERLAYLFEEVSRNGRVHTSEEVVTSKSGESIHVLVSTPRSETGTEPSPKSWKCPRISRKSAVSSRSSNRWGFWWDRSRTGSRAC